MICKPKCCLLIQPEAAEIGFRRLSRLWGGGLRLEKLDEPFRIRNLFRQSGFAGPGFVQWGIPLVSPVHQPRPDHWVMGTCLSVRCLYNQEKKTPSELSVGCVGSGPSGNRVIYIRSDLQVFGMDILFSPRPGTPGPTRVRLRIRSDPPRFILT